LFLVDLGGNQEIVIIQYSLSNILHEVLDQMVLQCWLDLLTHYLGLGLSEGNLDANDVPTPFEDMTKDHPSYVALPTCDLPVVWGILDQLEKVIDWCVLQT
jgi:hypothetical protein